MGTNITQKQWGWSSLEEDAPTCEVHRIDIMQGGFCSWHMHRKRSNVFLAARGRLVIEYHNDEGDIVQIVLQPGDSYTVPAKVVHRFRAPFESVMAYEVYFATPGGIGPYLVHDDIVRYSHGGIDAHTLSER